MTEIIKSVQLNILPLTSTKERKLLSLGNVYKSACNDLFEVIDCWDEIPKQPDLDKLTRYNVQHLIYTHIKSKYGLQSQLIVDAVKDTYSIHENNINGINNISISFNIPRSGNIRTTKRGNPVVSIATLKGRIGLPIVQDGGYKRFQEFINDGYKFTHFRLVFNGCWKVQVSIKKDVDIKQQYDSVLGIDMGVKHLATITVLSNDGKVLYQTYFGKDIAHRQRDIGIRRSKLQSFDAFKKLNKLRGYETNFVRTRCYQIAHEIIDIANKYNSRISIENLTHLNRSRLNRKSNRKVKRFPYDKFRVALETVCMENGILLKTVNPRNTSKTCSKCGELGKRNNANFRCDCGFICNADRNASKNIAQIVISADRIMADTYDFSIQTTDEGLSVATSVYSNDGISL